MAITAVSVRDFAMILVIGGRAPEYLRNDASMISLILEFSSHHRVIGAIGHGVQVLIAAGCAKGHTLTGHIHVALEIERAGGAYVERPVVRDGRMITAQNWKAHPEFYREVFACLNESVRV